MATKHYTRRQLALMMIPVLIRWAQASWDKPHYYADLSAAIGYGSNQIGDVLGEIKDVLDEVTKKTGKKIPPLNALVQSKSTKLPSDGFDYVIPNYSKLSPASKAGEVAKLNQTAHEYNWDWVLEVLELEPAKIFTEKDIQNLKKKSYVGYGGGEGKEHKTIKEHIYNSPESVGIKNVAFAEMEHDLPSGDRLDVYFELKNGNRVAVEVKPSTSPDEDITRGIFQCVKYKAVMDALRTVDYGRYDNDTLLVVAKPMSEANKRLANDLGIEYREDF